MKSPRFLDRGSKRLEKGGHDPHPRLASTIGDDTVVMS